MRDRDRRFELLAVADPTRLVELADRCLDTHEPFTLVRSPEIGAVSAQVREPVAALRFELGGPLADAVDALCADTEREAAAAGAREWARLSRTIVEFEDIP
jgi:alpha-D-ribose 1-methylphosphonate 5-triphosphate synthase subunit PhnG